MELVELTRRKSLPLKMKKLTVYYQTSPRDVVSSATGSFRFHNVRTSSWVNSQRNYLGGPLEEAIDDKPTVSECDEQPCSSKITDAKTIRLAPTKPSVRPIDMRPRKSLKVGGNVFVPNSAYAGAVSTAMPTSVPFSAIHFFSTLAVLLCVSVPMKLPKMVLGKFFGDPLNLACSIWAISRYCW